MKKISKHSPISLQQFKDAASMGGGWGYWGHERRKSKSDKQVVEAANNIKFPLWLLYSWADSRDARHYMDIYNSKDPLFESVLRDWYREISTWTSEQIQAEKSRFISQSIQYILEED